MTQAVLYARFSPRPDAHDCDSVAKQLERCRAYCAAHGYQVIAEKSDEDMSGSRADNRPGLRDAIGLACRAKAILVVYKLDRLARNTRDALNVLEQLQQAKADLASLTGQLNTRNPLGKFFFPQLAAFDELIREQGRERTSAAMRSYQADGRRMTRADRCPFGKEPNPIDPSQLIDCPEEQAALARMRELRAEGKGAKAITAALTAERFPSRGCGWHLTTVRRLLARENGKPAAR